MDEASAIAAFAALGQPTRLGVFKSLVAAHPAALPAGEIARLHGIPHNTLSTHLAILERAGLAVSAREGRTIRYGADIAGLTELVGYLTGDCCGGRPEVCGPVLATLLPPAGLDRLAGLRLAADTEPCCMPDKTGGTRR